MNFSNEFVSCIINIDGLNVSIKGSLINPSLYQSALYQEHLLFRNRNLAKFFLFSY